MSDTSRDGVGEGSVVAEGKGVSVGDAVGRNAVGVRVGARVAAGRTVATRGGGKVTMSVEGGWVQAVSMTTRMKAAGQRGMSGNDPVQN